MIVQLFHFPSDGECNSVNAFIPREPYITGTHTFLVWLAVLEMEWLTLAAAAGAASGSNH